MAVERRPSDEIRKVAMQQGMATLRRDGMEKVRLGMTTLEAMSCRTPVVATKFGGIRKNLNHEVDALMVDPGDEIEFGKAMIRVLGDETFAEKLAANGMKTIQDRFSWESIAATTLKFFQRYV